MTHIRLMERAMEKSGTNIASLVPKFDCPPIQNFIPTEFVSGGKSKFVSIVWKAYSNELKTVQNFCMPTEPGQQNHSAKLMYPPCSMTKLKFGEHEVNVYMMERGQGAFFSAEGIPAGQYTFDGATFKVSFDENSRSKKKKRKHRKVNNQTMKKSKKRTKTRRQSRGR